MILLMLRIGVCRYALVRSPSGFAVTVGPTQSVRGQRGRRGGIEQPEQCDQPDDRLTNERLNRSNQSAPEMSGAFLLFARAWIYQFYFRRSQLAPLAWREVAQPEISDAHTHQPQGRMPDGRRHPPHLTVLALDQFQPDPTIGDGFAETDGRGASWNFWSSGVSAERRTIFGSVNSGALPRRHYNLRLRLQNPCAAMQSFPALNHNSSFQFLQAFRCRDFFNLRPILALVGVARVKESFVPVRFIAQEQQPLGIGVEPSDGINIFWKPKFRERAVG
jgi:hypothetical protein